MIPAVDLSVVSTTYGPGPFQSIKNPKPLA